MRKKNIPYEKIWMKKNNQDHVNPVRFVVASENSRDRKFLGNNKLEGIV